MPAITLIPALDRTSTTFPADTDLYFGTRIPQLTNEMNAAIAAWNALFSGAAVTLPYNFDTAIAGSDPGPGNFRISTSGALTVGANFFVYMDPVGSNSADFTTLLASIMSSTTTSTLAHMRILNTLTMTNVILAVKSYSLSGGYATLSVTVLAVFGGGGNTLGAAGNPLMISIQRSGDQGAQGPTGTIVRRVSATTGVNSATPNITLYDLIALISVTGTVTVNAPTGTPTDGQGLMIRINDSGTACSLVFNATYYAGTDVPLPVSTAVGKVLYAGFIYNANKARWELVSQLYV